MRSRQLASAMRVSRTTAPVMFAVLSVLLLCRCASKHQPVEFAPYFPSRPQSFLSADQLQEIQEFEDRAELGLLEKRRLVELYQNEMRRLKPTAPRYEQVRLRLGVLNDDLTSYGADLKRLQTETRQFREPGTDEKPFSWKSVKIKREYQSAYQLWNRDQTEEALARVQQTLTNPKFESEATTAEWMRILNMRFRIALELSELPLIIASYEEMRRFQDCDPDTTQAGFLAALQFFLKGDRARAAELYAKQCDPDESPSNRLRRLYWEARFAENDPKLANAKYEEIVRTGVPGYYFYLAHQRLNRKLAYGPSALNSRSYLKRPLEVSAHVADLFMKAEDRLQRGLRRDASTYLMRASQILRNGTSAKDKEGLLYTAHLLQAAGSQLEAMRIYSVVSSEDLAPREEGETKSPIDNLAEMFPTPHIAEVDWLGAQWSVDPDFIYALMRQESAFNPAAVSYMDARGLMQLMPFLARSIAQQWRYHGYYNDRLLFHARENLKIAVFHLHTLQATLPHPALVAAAYNAGMKRSINWWRRNRDTPLDVFIELIPVNETRNYVKLVLRNYVHYRLIRAGGSLEPSVVPFVLPALPSSQVAG